MVRNCKILPPIFCRVRHVEENVIYQLSIKTHDEKCRLEIEHLTSTILSCKKCCRQYISYQAMKWTVRNVGKKYKIKVSIFFGHKSWYAVSIWILQTRDRKWNGAETKVLYHKNNQRDKPMLLIKINMHCITPMFKTL